MKRIALFASVLALAAGPAFAENISVDAKLLETLQARIAALESRVRDLESSGPGDAKSAPAPQADKKTQAAAPVTAAPSEKKTAPAPTRKYTIQEGDTVSEIARKHGIPRTAFMEANNIREGQQIYIGDQVNIPSPPSAAPRPAGGGQIAAQQNSGASTTYTIKYGDTLSSIARKHNVTVEAIKAANGMSSDEIGGGQKLKIPSGASSSKPVANNGTPAPDSAKKSDSKSGEPAAPTAGKSELLRQNETYGLYTVEKGDTLFSLARDFFTTLDELQRLNEMGKSTVLRPGRDMVVPTSKYFEHHKLAGN